MSAGYEAGSQQCMAPRGRCPPLLLKDCLEGTGVFATQLVFFLTRSHISYWLASSCICSGPAMDLELNGMEDLEFLGFIFEDFEAYKYIYTYVHIYIYIYEPLGS